MFVQNSGKHRLPPPAAGRGRRARPNADRRADAALVNKLRDAARGHGLFRPGAHILVGVSGGADSIALLALLKELAPAWKLRLTAAHLDHRIRGAAAAADREFTRSFARRLGIDFICRRADVPRLARQRGISLEMAGREARYAFFVRAARRLGCDAAATAHTADDQAETILINLARGAGTDGLTGIPRATRIKRLPIVRPLRDVSRPELLAFLRRRKLAWREDASNADGMYIRNRVRHEILPLLEARLNPSIRRALLRAAEILEKENEWMDSMAAAILAACCRAPKGGGNAPGPLDARRLAAQPVAARRRVLRRWLAAAGLPRSRLDFETVERLDGLLMSRPTGNASTLPGGLAACKRGGNLSLIAKSAPPDRAFRVPLKIPGTTPIPELGLAVTAAIAPGIVRDKPAGIGQYPACASLSTKTWRRRRMFARSWQPGDRMSPIGLAGSKKLQDIFSDFKTPRETRSSIPVFDCGGRPVWVPGYRIAREWAVGGGERLALQLAVERCGSGLRRQGGLRLNQKNYKLKIQNNFSCFHGGGGGFGR